MLKESHEVAAWAKRHYLYFFVLGAIPFLAMILLDSILSISFVIGLLLWLILLSLSLYYKNPATLKTALPLSVLILGVNIYPSLAGSPLFTGTQLVYVVAFLFSPIYSPFPPLLPILLLVISFFQENDVDFALKAVAMSYIGFTVLFTIYWFYSTLAYPNYVLTND